MISIPTLSKYSVPNKSILQSKRVGGNFQVIYLVTYILFLANFCGDFCSDFWDNFLDASYTFQNYFNSAPLNSIKATTILFFQSTNKRPVRLFGTLEQESCKVRMYSCNKITTTQIQISRQN